MGVLPPHHDGSDECQPDKEVAGELLGYVNPRVEDIAQDDIAENHDDHGGAQEDQEPLQTREEVGYSPVHRYSLSPVPAHIILFASDDCSRSLTGKVSLI